MSRWSDFKQRAAAFLTGVREKMPSRTPGRQTAAERKKRCTVKPALLEFRCRGKEFFTVHSEKITFPFRIGKAADNDLVLPARDRTSADYEIYFENVKGRIVVKAAAETRFFYVHGVPKSSWQLPAEDRIAFGDCELFVSPAQKLKVSPCDVHRLESLNGPLKGKIIRIEKTPFRIGSGAECDLRLQDSVVSGSHAEIRIAANGEAWLKDCQSLNGTFVNGRRLGAQERVLMDSDRITAAYFLFRFLDKNVSHTRSHFLRNLMAAAAVLAAVLAVFLLLYLRVPYASQVAVAVERLMQEEKFAEAERLLNRMPEARNYKDHEAVYFNLRNRLTVYRTTSSAWNSFRKCVNDGYFSNAGEYIGKLDLSRETAWNWNAANVRARMEFARKCVQCWRMHRELRNLLRSSSRLVDPAYLASVYAEYSQSPDIRPGKNPPEWMKPLYRDLDASLQLLQRKCRQFERINAALELLAADKADFAQVRAKLDEEQKDAGCLRYYLLKLDVVFRQLAAVQQTIADNLEHLTNYEYEQIDRSPDFPGVENCAAYPALKAKREQLLERHYRLLNAEAAIRSQGDFRQFLNSDKLKQLLEFDAGKFVKSDVFTCFNRPLSEFMQDRDSAYNNELGMRYWYGMIQQTLTLDKTGYDLSELYSNERALPLFKAGRAFNELYSIVSHPEGKVLLRNKFGQDMKQVSAIMKRLDEMAAQADEIAEREPGSRWYLVMKLVVFVFRPAAAAPQEIARYRNYWKEYRQKLQELVDRYDPLDYRNSAELRKQIFAIAIPGDPLVSGIWNDVE